MQKGEIHRTEEAEFLRKWEPAYTKLRVQFPKHYDFICSLNPIYYLELEIFANLGKAIPVFTSHSFVNLVGLRSWLGHWNKCVQSKSKNDGKLARCLFTKANDTSTVNHKMKLHIICFTKQTLQIR